MSWYKKSDSAKLTETVRKWMIQAYYGNPSLQLVDADISGVVPSLGDDQSIELGASMAKSQLGLTEFTPTQIGVLDYIRNRIMSVGAPKQNQNNLGDEIQEAPMDQSIAPEAPQTGEEPGYV